MPTYLYTLKSRRIDITPNQYSIVQEFSGETPCKISGADLEDIKKQCSLMDRHQEELKHSGLKSIEATVQWSL